MSIILSIVLEKDPQQPVSKKLLYQDTPQEEDDIIIYDNNANYN